MEIALTPAQRAWLEAKMTKGEFASLQEAASAAITESMALDIDDLVWAMRGGRPPERSKKPATQA